MSAAAEVVQADPRWRALRERDASADGSFVYSVASTGVFCRPSCAARAPRPEHVAFHDSPEAARRAGFRPCLRCRPEEPPLAQRRAEVVAELCRFIDGSAEAPSVTELAERAGWSASHLHRVFRSVTGVTPRRYIAGREAARIRAELPRAGSVTEAVYTSGAGSPARFYRAASGALGMSPSAFRRGAPGERIRYTLGQSSLGRVLVAATERGVCAVSLGDDADALVEALRRRFNQATLQPAGEELDALVARIVGQVERPEAEVSLPLDVRGTAFQLRVWQALTEIPAGQTRSYGELAAALGDPGASRAVASACSQNPVAVVIPCHRVVRADGALSGYRWGVARKRALLSREADVEG
ncbi:MAG: bifunctional DNA-binding transcriptional regulator/O6-methylguanine-DNA methyltransferase Ada [Alphaproteobacteria bacterium]|nr:bifunctional DNA-binding transcriptional regulator/O6-methylguanine-DNA methyltransferase Ada [Alphaproteobacteria bacterium]